MESHPFGAEHDRLRAEHDLISRQLDTLVTSEDRQHDPLAARAVNLRRDGLVWDDRRLVNDLEPRVLLAQDTPAGRVGIPDRKRVL